MKKRKLCVLGLSAFLTFSQNNVFSQITLSKDYVHKDPKLIGTFQGIDFKEGGFSSLYPISGTNGKEFWTISDRGVNIDAANANISGCRPTYDKIYAFPNYAPKIHRIRIEGNSIKVLRTITMKRPDGSGATGIINPTGFGSTSAEVASTDTVQNCANFNSKVADKDVWGIDSEGLVVDAEGNFWIAEEGGPTIWKLNKNGVVVKRYSPYANMPGAEKEDVAIDTVFKYRKNNRGFEGLSITPNGKLYAIIQSPILYPTKSVGENSRIHRILEIDPKTDQTRMFAYLNDGIIGASGSNQIRLRDWKIGDMAAINDNEFLVIEQALRGTTDRKFVYKINIANATNVNSGLYSGMTLEALVDATGLTNNSIVPVEKTLFMDMLANSWPSNLEKAEGLAIINDSTLAFVNDNDFGQYSPTENGVATPSNIESHLFTYALSGSNKIVGLKQLESNLANGLTGPTTFESPYLLPTQKDVKFTSILTAGDTIGSYKMVGTPDGVGAFDNGDGTFTMLVNHEFGNTAGVVRAHGQKGAFVSKWIINKNDLSVQKGSDLIQNVKLWDGTTYQTYNATNASPLAALSRFCSADLPEVSAFYNPKTGLGTQSRIFMNGEENGSEGRAFAHVVTGPEAGNSYELPRMGKYSFENSVANPSTGDKTVVVGTDDATPGQVYVYIGTKTNTGNEIEKAGLTNGKLYGVAVTGLTTETSVSVPAANTAFTLADLGNVENTTGATLNTNSNNAGVTNFLRPEDGAWDPSNPNDFYFATTNSFSNPSRLWKLHFTDLTKPELGGTITAVLDGTEGQKMLDNLTIDNAGHVLLVEDVGNNAHIGKVWEYNIQKDTLVQIGTHDESRFLTGAANYLTQDEEASGIIDAQAILGKGMFLLVDQTHYAVPGELVEGGQILAMYNPNTADSAVVITKQPNQTYEVCENGNISIGINADHASKYQWQIESNGKFTDLTEGANYKGVNTKELMLQNVTRKMNGITVRCLASRNAGLAEVSGNAKLMVNNIDSTTTESTICASNLPYSWGGKNYDKAGTYTIKYASKKGCDSISTLKLNVTSINDSIKLENGILQLAQENAMYKWLDCKTNQVISNETSATLNTKIDGTFAAIIDYKSCVDTTECISISKLGLNTLDDTFVQLYPNPASDRIQLKVNVSVQNVEYTLMDASGKTMLVGQLNQSNEIAIPVENFVNGVYIMKVTMDNKIQNYKVTISH
jgi:hypothetical protein